MSDFSAAAPGYKNNLKEQLQWLQNEYKLEEDPVVKMARENLLKLRKKPSTENSNPILEMHSFEAPLDACTHPESRIEELPRSVAIQTNVPIQVEEPIPRLSVNISDMKNLDFSEGFFEMDLDAALPTLPLPAITPSGLRDAVEIFDSPEDPIFYDLSDELDVPIEESKGAVDNDLHEQVADPELLDDFIQSWTPKMATSISIDERVSVGTKNSWTTPSTISPSALPFEKVTINSTISELPSPSAPKETRNDNYEVEQRMKELLAEKTRLSMEICDVMELHEYADPTEAENLGSRLRELRQRRKNVDAALEQLKLSGNALSRPMPNIASNEALADIILSPPHKAQNNQASLACDEWKRRDFPWTRNMKKGMKQYKCIYIISINTLKRF